MHYLSKELTKALGLKESEIDYLVWLRIKDGAAYGSRKRHFSHF